MIDKPLEDAERERACQLWEEGGWVFTTPRGRPLSLNTDYHEWKDLLAAAGLRDARLHDARHTAATVLLIVGTQQRAVMDVMGWSNGDMVKRYQHVTDPIRQDIAKRIGGAIWKPKKATKGKKKGKENGNEGGPEGATTAA